MPRSALVLALILTAPALAQTSGGGPEDAIAALMRAIYAGDATAYERVTLPHPRRALLSRGGALNEEALRELDEYPDALQLHPMRPFTYQGLAVEPDAQGAYPVGTTALFMAAHRGGPMAVRLSLQPEGWRVDLRWWLAMADLAENGWPPPGTADFAARALTGALLQLDREAVAALAVPGADLGLLFAGAPAQPEPSGHLDALAAEMPLVEIGPGEHYALPTGGVVEGTDAPDRKLLVGLFGAIEVPFVVRRIGEEWRVEAQPYFYYLMQ